MTFILGYFFSLCIGICLMTFRDDFFMIVQDVVKPFKKKFNFYQIIHVLMVLIMIPISIPFSLYVIFKG